MKSIFDTNRASIYESTYSDRLKREKNVRKSWKKLQKTRKASLLYDDIYWKVYNEEEEYYLFCYGMEIIKEAGEYLGNNDIYMLEQLAEILTLPKEKNLVPFFVSKINKFVCYPQDNDLTIYEILSQINTNKEAEIIYDVVRRNTFLKSYKRGYSEARKRKTRKRKLTNTYEHQLRFERHFLERLLQGENVGINRSKKISQILKYI
ncbi:hypothetical protein [Sulfurimonas sp. NWX79]|uniref:hypothetical protein n=1 Tax=Sulfurimonas sp. NWX79 TaxID=2925412 RepID=UPI003204970C